MNPFFSVLLGEASVQLGGPLDEGAALHADQPQVGPGLGHQQVHQAGVAALQLEMFVIVTCDLSVHMYVTTFLHCHTFVTRYEKIFQYEEI